MQRGIFEESGLFITLKTLDSAFNLRSEALSTVFERMINQYGIILQKSITSDIGTNILLGNNTNFASGIGDWTGTGVTWDSAGQRLKIDASAESTATILLNLLSKGNGRYRLTFGFASASLYHITLNGVEVSGSGASTWTGEVILNSSNLAVVPLAISAIAGTYLYLDNVIFEAIQTSINSTDGLCEIGDAHHVTIKAFDAIVKDDDAMVKGVSVATNQSIDLTTGYADGSWKILAQVKERNYEDGTITLTNGSKNVVGSETLFTKHLGKKMQIVILDSVDGNNGVYEIESITSDTLALLKDNYTGLTEATLPYSIGGVFPDPNVYPSTIAGYRVYAMDSYEFIITQATKETHQLYLCDVTITGGIVTAIVDQRMPFKLKRHEHLLADITDFVVKAGTILGVGSEKAVDGVSIGLNTNKELEVPLGGIVFSKIQNISAPNMLVGRKTAGEGSPEEIPVDGVTLEIDSTNGLQVKTITEANLDCKIYRAKITQSGTSDPTAFVVKNTLGMTPVWKRDNAGQYYANFNASTTNPLNVFARISPAIGADAKFLECDAIYTAPFMQIRVNTLNIDGDTSDDLLVGEAVEIITYPTV
jgi:hypothetical protein